MAAKSGSKLNRNAKALFELLQTQKSGDVISTEQILSHTGYKEISIRTYRNKGKLSGFLLPEGTDFRVVQDGSEINELDFARAITQVNDSPVTLASGMKLTGRKGVYTLIEFIGGGAVGRVWSASEAGKNTRVAVKVLVPRPDLLAEDKIDGVRERFRRESQNGRKVKHLNVVQLRDHGEIKSRRSPAPFLVMELAEGNVGELLAKGPLQPEETLPIVRSVLSGTKYLHGIDCIHRDIKPLNILFTGDRYYLGDLGIVRWPDFNPAFTGSATITRASIQLGSWSYMAPEQQKAPHEASSASDIYALGVTWYEMLTGNTASQAEFAVQKQPAPSTIASINELISRMTKYDPAERPEAAEVMVAIDEIAEEIGLPL